MSTSDGDVTVEQTPITKEQVEKGCKIIDNRVVCPNTVSQRDGVTTIQLGDQKITGMRCIENKKSGELQCTVNSRAKK